jgi:hypothetical protein
MMSGRQAHFELAHLTSRTLVCFHGSDGGVITMAPDFGGCYVYVTSLK